MQFTHLNDSVSDDVRATTNAMMMPMNFRDNHNDDDDTDVDDADDQDAFDDDGEQNDDYSVTAAALP